MTAALDQFMELAAQRLAVPLGFLLNPRNRYDRDVRVARWAITWLLKRFGLSSKQIGETLRQSSHTSTVVRMRRHPLESVRPVVEYLERAVPPDLLRDIKHLKPVVGTRRECLYCGSHDLQRVNGKARHRVCRSCGAEVPVLRSLTPRGPNRHKRSRCPACGSAMRLGRYTAFCPECPVPEAAMARVRSETAAPWRPDRCRQEFGRRTA